MSDHTECKLGRVCIAYLLGSLNQRNALIKVRDAYPTASSLFVVGGLSAWYILTGRQIDFFLKSFKVALTGVIFVVPVQLALGHGSGRDVFANQPAKGAAIEAHWITNQDGTGAAWNLIAWPNQAEQKNDWAISIPDGLSILATGYRHGRVHGLKSFSLADQPTAIPLIFYSFRLMVVIGIIFLGLMLWTLAIRLKGQLSSAAICSNHWLLRAWIASIPLGYLATECGWIVREVGRQPWVVYGLLRTRDAASTLPMPVVAVSLVTFIVIYSILFMLFLFFAARWADHETGRYLNFFLILAVFAFFMLLRALWRRFEVMAFFWSFIIALASITAVTIGYYPYMIPVSVLLTQAASSSKTLIFMLSSIGLLIPVMLVYSGYQYLVFRGKVKMNE